MGEPRMTTAVVFAYHNVGVRCLQVLLAHGVEILLLVTHRDNPQENIWFDSVAALAARHGIPTVTPDDANSHEFVDRVRALQPDLLFSFYYRHMICPALLGAARHGAYNMHGSLLPRYRGRVPVNWAVLNGEHRTGATLHRMIDKPDAGGIVGQQWVPILPNDTAREVFDKVTVAAECVLDRALPTLLTGTAPNIPQDLGKGSYFGGRKPEDGRIDWTRSAWEIHNLVRAVAPPYPGAFTEVKGHEVRLLRTWWTRDAAQQPEPGAPGLFIRQGGVFARGADQRAVRVLSFTVDGKPLLGDAVTELFGTQS